MQNNFHTKKSNSSLDLPVIQKQIKVYKFWQELLNNFPKTSKYSLGAKIDATLLETIELTFNTSHLRGKQKLEQISHAGTKLDLVKFFLRIAWEIKALDNKKYAAISEQLDEIGRMIGGWAKQIKNLQK
jgi:hypothetical protein